MRGCLAHVASLPEEELGAAWCVAGRDRNRDRDRREVQVRSGPTTTLGEMVKVDVCKRPVRAFDGPSRMEMPNLNCFVDGTVAGKNSRSSASTDS